MKRRLANIAVLVLLAMGMSVVVPPSVTHASTGGAPCIDPQHPAAPDDLSAVYYLDRLKADAEGRLSAQTARPGDIITLTHDGTTVSDYSYTIGWSQTSGTTGTIRATSVRDLWLRASHPDRHNFYNHEFVVPEDAEPGEEIVLTLTIDHHCTSSASVQDHTLTVLRPPSETETETQEPAPANQRPTVTASDDVTVNPGQRVRLTATGKDAETRSSQLTYEWTLNEHTWPPSNWDDADADGFFRTRSITFNAYEESDGPTEAHHYRFLVRVIDGAGLRSEWDEVYVHVNSNEEQWLRDNPYVEPVVEVEPEPVPEPEPEPETAVATEHLETAWASLLTALAAGHEDGTEIVIRATSSGSVVITITPQ